MNIATGVSLNGYRVYCDVVLAAEGGFVLRLATRREGPEPPEEERVWCPPDACPYTEQEEAERAAHRILGQVKGVSQSGEPLYA